MTKVIIHENGIILKETDNTPIATITSKNDIPLTPTPTFRKLQIRFINGKKGFLYYGGFIADSFTVGCHLPCIWGKHCLRYKKRECLENPELKGLGYYISDIEI